MDYNEHNNEAEALFATKRKQQQAEEAERKRLEELEQQKRQMAEEVKRLEALQTTQRAQEARMAWEAQQAQQTYGVPGTGAAPTGEKKGLDPKKKKIILIGALAALAVVALAVVLILVLGSKSKPTDEPSGSRGVETTEEADLTLFYGMWKYDDYSNRIGINGDGTWTWYDRDGGETSSGVYRWRSGWLLLEDEDGTAVYALSLGEDGRLYDIEGDSLSPYEEPDVPELVTPWFEDHGMYVNYQYGDPAKTVMSGFSLQGKETNTYARIPAYWYVEQISRQSTGDGNCVITLVASLTTDGNTMPAFASKEGYWFRTSWEICDYYTGYYLPKSFNEDTLFSYSYEANGETVHVEFSYTYEYAMADDASYNWVFTLTVRMPEDYDGLVLTCNDAAESYEKLEQRRGCYNRSDVLPLDEFPDWQDFASGLICKINE